MCSSSDRRPTRLEYSIFFFLSQPPYFGCQFPGPHVCTPAKTSRIDPTKICQFSENTFLIKREKQTCTEQRTIGRGHQFLHPHPGHYRQIAPPKRKPSCDIISRCLRGLLRGQVFNTKIDLLPQSTSKARWSQLTPVECQEDGVPSKTGERHIRYLYFLVEVSESYGQRWCRARRFAHT